MASPGTELAIGFIFLVVAYLINLTVLVPLADQIAVAQASANVTGANDTLLSLILTVVIAGLVIGALVFLTTGTIGAAKGFSASRSRRKR